MQPCPRIGDIPDIFKVDRETFWKDEGTCSGCGSLSPELFFKSIEDGAVLTPTDKDYKVYVDTAQAPLVGAVRKFYFYHLTKDEMKKFVSLCNTEGAVKFKSPASPFKRPGGFYVLPFFMNKSV